MAHYEALSFDKNPNADKRKNSFLQTMAQSCSKILIVFTVVHLWMPAKVPNNIPVCQSQLKYHQVSSIMAQVSETIQQPNPVEEP